MKPLSQIVQESNRRNGEIIGEASMLWSENPKGVFNDTRACELIVELRHSQISLLLGVIEIMEGDLKEFLEAKKRLEEKFYTNSKVAKGIFGELNGAIGTLQDQIEKIKKEIETIKQGV